MPRIVALDVGDATIGVAATDELGLAVHPVRTIRRTASIKVDLRAVEELLRELNAEKVVVGLPVHEWRAESGEPRAEEGPHPGPPHSGEGEEKAPSPQPSPPGEGEGEGPHPNPPHLGEGEADQREGAQAAKVRDFFDRLARRIRIPAVLWDESLSTVEAEQMLLEADVSRAKRRKVIDQVAAVVILRSYLAAPNT